MGKSTTITIAFLINEYVISFKICIYGGKPANEGIPINKQIIETINFCNPIYLNGC